ncbi:MAG TPA: histidine triad nucleotide-binding protein [Gemmatimonadaceae bacterium]|nr:histidine triad nucleotide-binding protein [Gemmatimonadaceae bacterium]
MTDCLFCRISRGEIPAAKIAENDECLAFRDISPQAPVHVLVIPKKHYASLNEVPAGELTVVARMQDMAREVAVSEGIAATGYRSVINTGDEGGQTVSHLHLHLLGGRHMKWPPG